MKSNDYIAVELSNDISDGRRVVIWEHLCKHFFDREDDDATIFTTARKFKNYLNKSNSDINDFNIYLDGNSIDEQDLEFFI